LSFRAIYLGAALDDLKAQSKNDNGAIAGLHDRLRAVDGDMTEDDIRSVIAEWLDDPELIATPELQEGDRVRVEIAGPAGTEETMVKVAGKLIDVFLKGAAVCRGCSPRYLRISRLRRLPRLCSRTN